jgi:hypothetical protein
MPTAYQRLKAIIARVGNPGLRREVLIVLKAFRAEARAIPGEARAFYAGIGKKGGEARTQAMTPKQRTRAARKAARARWNKQRSNSNV